MLCVLVRRELIAASPGRLLLIQGLMDWLQTRCMYVDLQTYECFMGQAIDTVRVLASKRVGIFLLLFLFIFLFFY